MEKREREKNEIKKSRGGYAVKTKKEWLRAAPIKSA